MTERELMLTEEKENRAEQGAAGGMSEAATAGYSIKTFTSASELEALRPAWERFQWHPNSDIDFFTCIIEARGEVLRPHVIALYRDGSPVAILAGRLEEKKLKFKFAYKELYKPTLKIVTVVYGGVLGDASAENTRMLYNEMEKLLRSGDADIVYFEHLPEESEFYKTLRASPSFTLKDHFPERITHWELTLTGSAEGFYKNLSTKKRYWFRKNERKLREHFADDVQVKCYREPKDLETIFRDVEEVAKLTYHRGLGVGFMDNEEFRDRFRLTLEKGWQNVYVLYTGGKPCSFWIGTLYKNRFNLNFTGYKPEFSSFEPGMILFAKMLEDLSERKVPKFDFGFGDAVYKQHYGDNSWKEASVIVFSPTAKGLKLNIARFLSGTVSWAGKSVAKDLKLIGKIKKTWRDSVTSGETEKKGKQNGKK